MTVLAQGSPSYPSYRSGLLLVLSAGVCWSTVGLVVRLMDDAGAWQILFYRSISLSLFLFLVICLQSGGRPLQVYRRAGWSGLCGGLALVLAFCGSIISVLNTTIANAMFLFATAPFFAAILGRLILGESVRRATWIAMAVAGVGVTLMVTEGIAVGNWLGNLAAVGSAIGFAFFTIALRWGRNDNMLPSVSLGGLFTTLFAVAVCLVLGQPLGLSPHDAGLATFLGVFQLGLGLSIYTIGAKVVPAADLALLSMTEVMLGPIWVWLFLGETAGLLTLLGGGILLAAIGGNALTGLRRPPPPLGL